MRRLVLVLGWLFGLRFADDNHVVPIMWLDRFHRVGGPGFFWIVPFFEKTLPQVKQSLYVVNLNLNEILSKDGLPFRMKLTILFSFNPDDAVKSAASVLVKSNTSLLEMIISDYASQGLRRLAARYDAEELWGPGLSYIERDLTHFLTAQTSALGIKPLRSGGILIKEVELPTRVKDAIEKIRHLRETLKTLSLYPAPALIDQAIRSVFTGQLNDKEMVMLLSMLNQSPGTEPGYMLDMNSLREQKQAR